MHAQNRANAKYYAVSRVLNSWVRHTKIATSNAFPVNGGVCNAKPAPYRANQLETFASRKESASPTASKNITSSDIKSAPYPRLSRGARLEVHAKLHDVPQEHLRVRVNRQPRELHSGVVLGDGGRYRLCIEGAHADAGWGGDVVADAMAQAGQSLAGCVDQRPPNRPVRMAMQVVQ